MPLTALLPDGAVDLTACSDEAWSALHRPRTPAPLSCRGCEGSLHAKVSPRGLRFFAHNRRTEHCPTNGESQDHLTLKAALAGMIRQSGNTPIVEATPGAGDAGGWRADVLGIGANGLRVAFEVQLAPMTVSEGRERTARYTADGIRTVWVTTRKAPWLYGLPGVQVDPEQDHLVLEGIAELVEDRWRVRQGYVLARYVPLWLAGRLTDVAEVNLYENRPSGLFARTGAVVWTVERDAQRWRDLQQQWRAADAREAKERETHARNLAALRERQVRLLNVVVPKIAARAAAGHHVYLGVPATYWQEHRPIELDSARGNEKTGQGCPIWTGPHAGELSLRAVICPPAHRVTPALGRSWRDRRVAVVLAGRREAEQVAGALGWPVEQVTIVDEGAASR